jgi:hypothetical protein
LGFLSGFLGFLAFSVWSMGVNFRWLASPSADNHPQYITPYSVGTHPLTSSQISVDCLSACTFYFSNHAILIYWLPSVKSACTFYFRNNIILIYWLPSVKCICSNILLATDHNNLAVSLQFAYVRLQRWIAFRIPNLVGESDLAYICARPPR